MFPYDTGRSLKPFIEEFEKMGVTVHININILDGFEEYKKASVCWGLIR